jgi:hypothetical protein
VALSNSRLERFENGQVTFRYRDNRSQQLHRVTLTAEEFIHRFLLHTLPRSFAKVRYYGLFSPAARPLREQARTLLTATAVTAAAHTAQSPSSLPIAPAPAIPAPPGNCSLSLLSAGPTTATRCPAAPAPVSSRTSTSERTKGPAMTLSRALLALTDTAPPALTCFTPALATALSAFRVARVCQALKLRQSLKTILILLRLLTRRVAMCCHLPLFHRAWSPNSLSFSK